MFTYLASVFLIFLSLGCIFCCTKKLKKTVIGEDDSLILSPTVYKGTELKLSGYYYSLGNKRIQQSYFLYNNGCLICGGGSDESANPNAFLENVFTSNSFDANIKKTKSYWGLFKIEGSKIFLEHWYPTEPPLKSALKEGVILNDTTFKIMSIQRSNGSEFKEITEFYSFRQFKQKPDSTNSFIK